MTSRRIHRRLQLEELEPRVLLATFNLAPGVPLQLKDDGGILMATVTLGGKVGDGTVDWDPTASFEGTITSIVLNNTTQASRLTITTPKGREVNLQDVTVNGSLKSFTGKTTDLIGGITITGTLGTLNLDDVDTQGALSIGAPIGPKDFVTLIFGEVDGLGVTSGTPVKSLSAAGWYCEDADLRTIQAPSFGAVTINGDLDAAISATVGSIGNVTIKGGNLNGSLLAPNGAIGNITVTGLAWFDKEDGSGGFEGGSVGSHLIQAGTVNGKSIGNIMLTGGRFDAETVTAAGDVGNIMTKTVRYLVAKDEGGSWYEVAGGGVGAQMEVQGKVGNINIAGGDLDGRIHAVKGIGVVTLNGFLGKSEEERLEANFTGLLASETSIGNVSIKGGSIDGGTLSAGNSIGNVMVQAQTYNATKRYDKEMEDWDIRDGGFLGGTLNLIIELGQGNPAAKLGVITGIGVEGTITGHVPFAPASVKILSKSATYVFTYDYDENDKLVPVKETIGGSDGQGVSLIVNDLQLWP